MAARSKAKSKTKKKRGKCSMDTSKLVAARDKLNADFGTLIKSATVDQATIDKLTDETMALDNDVVAVSTQQATV